MPQPHLPVELLRYIVILSVHMTPEDDARHDLLMRLTSSYHLLRSLTLAEKSIWAEIHLDDSSFQNEAVSETLHAPSRFLQYAKRFKDASLSLQISTLRHYTTSAKSSTHSRRGAIPLPSSVEHDKPTHHAEKTRFWETFGHAYADHCAELVLRVPRVDENCFTIPLPIMPRLNSLSIIHPPRDPSDFNPPPQSPPTLTVFSVDQPELALEKLCIGWDWAIFSSLRTPSMSRMKVLHVGGPASTVQRLFKDCLPTCLELQELELSFERFTDFRPHLPIADTLDLSMVEVVLLPALDTLILWNFHFCSIKKLLDTPRLHRLTVGGAVAIPIILPKSLATNPATPPSLPLLSELRIGSENYPHFNQAQPHQIITVFQLGSLVRRTTTLQTLEFVHRPDAFAIIQHALLSRPGTVTHPDLRSLTLRGCSPSMRHRDELQGLSFGNELRGLSLDNDDEVIRRLDQQAGQAPNELCWPADVRVKALHRVLRHYPAAQGRMIEEGTLFWSREDKSFLSNYNGPASGQLCVECIQDVEPWIPAEVIYGLKPESKKETF